jgi:hypothetical protein
VSALVRQRIAALEARRVDGQTLVPRQVRDQRYHAATADLPDDRLSQTVRAMLDARAKEITLAGDPDESRD